MAHEPEIEAQMTENVSPVDFIGPNAPTGAGETDINGLHVCANLKCEKPARSSRRHGMFCGATCRSWVYRHPEDLRRDKKLCLVERQKASRDPYSEQFKAQTQQVLRMLQNGPRTTGDFLSASIGRFGARIGELRAAGYIIRMRKTHEHGAVYRLEEAK